MNYIGVDCHISTLEFAVVNERGTITRKAKVNTGVKEFMAFVKDIPKPRKIFIEEGELASWLLETSLNFGEQLIITDPKINKWRDKLSKNKITHLIVEELWVQLDQLFKSKEKLKRNIRTQSKKYPEIKKFIKIPGIGLIHAVTISAIMETPHRFANKKKIWMYAGVGLMERSSGEKVYSKKLTRDYNRPLKNAIKKSAEAAIIAKDNQFRRQYLKLTIEKAIPSHKAKLTVARSMLAAMYGMWKKGEEYDPEIDKKRSQGIKR